MPGSPHDLNLPAWGPYTKRYIGVSHIADARRGRRFDLSAFPGFYRRKVDVPNVMWESGYHPWEAAPNLAYFSHRHELQWRDEVYCDIACARLSDDARMIRCACVNATDAPQQLVLHFMASLHFPPPRPYVTEILRPATVQLPPGAHWIDAQDYVELTFATPRPTDTLVADGLRRGEVRGSGFTGYGGVGTGFGVEAGDTVAYAFALDRAMPAAALVLRYRVARGQTSALHCAGVRAARLELTGDGDFATVTVATGDLAPGDHVLRLTAEGGVPVDLDGFAVVAAGDAGRVGCALTDWQPQPVIAPGPHPQSLVLKYADVDGWYGLAWDWADYVIREFRSAELDQLLRATVHHHTRTVLEGEGEGHYTNVFMRPIVLAPGETRVVRGMVCTGDREGVVRQLRDWHAGAWDREAVYEAARGAAVALDPTPAGEGYRFSQERLAATLLTNVVYPIYARRAYIRHNTPGRWWDCLYTWDSGFIGLGLADLDHGRAADCLRAYLTPPDDPDAAFIHHGSPVPTQHALFHDLWNRTQSRELLDFCYPRLRQYYRFLAGKLGSSTTRALRSNLLKTWDYFYNSGGWDDYPPQVHVHEHGLEGRVAPVITTAQAIRAAKILRLAADSLGLADDRAEYDADIATFSAALQEHAWDAASGYFGYVEHDERGEPAGILRHTSGENFNRGLDGCYPLVAGICTPEQEARIVAHLTSPGRLWTPIGITAVDQGAPYYRADGYWNGAVWMAHQWYFWKTCLDLGRPDLARRIALAGLEVWRTEVERTYNCFEHFIVASGRGAGWHHFGGLSAPVLNWFSAYYRPGRLTVGLDAWVVAHRFAEDRSALSAEIVFAGQPRQRPSLLVTLAPGPCYRATWDGVAVDCVEGPQGCLTITLPADTTRGRLEIGRHQG